MRSGSSIRRLAVLTLLVLGTVPLALGSDLIAVKGARQLQVPFDDGDSFLVAFHDPRTDQERRLVFRLYMVDCVETRADGEIYARRLLEQARYYGVEDPAPLVEDGLAAREFVRRTLARPFTLHTAFSKAPGSPDSVRYYAYITTGSGDDLGELLVSRGLARVHGVGHTREGRTSALQRRDLYDLELAAAMTRRGIWARTDPERLVALRRAMRDDKRELAAISRAAGESSRIDVNRATVDELTGLDGVGKVIARRIVAGRPYGKPEDLLAVRGIGPDTLAKIRGRLVFRSGTGGP